VEDGAGAMPDTSSGIDRGDCRHARRRTQKSRTGGHLGHASGVDTAALALVKVGAHPHPRLVLRITGGSLATISQKLANWLLRLALRDVNPNQRSLELPMKVGLRLQLSVAHVVDAGRFAPALVAANQARIESSDFEFAAAQRGIVDALRTKGFFTCVERAPR
jgi:hypothetical protein